MADHYGSLSFDEAIRFFRGKRLVPTERWTDLWKQDHDAAFMVAGAMKADLLGDLHSAIDKAISQGTTLAEFRKDFDAIVAKHGWTGWAGEGSKAGRAWRTQVIYETNLRTAYQAGRWAQVQAGKQWRPYLLYRHSDLSIHPRPLHVKWDGLVVSVDDPWVQTHWPPNGWGCKCKMFPLAERDLRRMGKSGPDIPPDDGFYEWTDKVTGEVHRVPSGIDPGWDYAPGASRVDLLREEMERKAARLPRPIAEQFSKDIDVTPAREKTRSEAIREVLEHGRSNHAEMAVAYDMNGHVLLRKQGGPTGVELSFDDLEVLRSADRSILVHNHTKGGSLSFADWSLQADHLSEIVAVSHDSTVYSGSVINRRKVLDHYDLLSKIFYIALKDSVDRGLITENEANTRRIHMINMVMANIGWVRYQAITDDGFSVSLSVAAMDLISKITKIVMEKL